MQLTNVLTWQYTQLENNLKSVEAIIRMADPATLTTFRDSGNGWTALEVLCHLRDFEGIFIERSKVTIEQEDAPLPFPSPDEMATAGNYNQQNVESVLADWKANRAKLLAYLRERSDSDWERTAIHPKRGKLTLYEQLTLVTMHDTTHLEQLTRTLNEKKLPA